MSDKRHIVIVDITTKKMVIYNNGQVFLNAEDARKHFDNLHSDYPLSKYNYLTIPVEAEKCDGEPFGEGRDLHIAKHTFMGGKERKCVQRYLTISNLLKQSASMRST